MGMGSVGADMKRVALENVEGSGGERVVEEQVEGDEWDGEDGTGGEDAVGVGCEGDERSINKS